MSDKPRLELVIAVFTTFAPIAYFAKIGDLSGIYLKPSTNLPISFDFMKQQELSLLFYANRLVLGAETNVVLFVATTLFVIGLHTSVKCCAAEGVRRRARLLGIAATVPIFVALVLVSHPVFKGLFEFSLEQIDRAVALKRSTLGFDPSFDRADDLITFSSYFLMAGGVSAAIGLGLLCWQDETVTLEWRGRRLRLFLIVYAVMLSAWTIQIRSSLDVYALIGSNDIFRKPMETFANAVGAYWGITGSLILIIAFIGPIFLWQRDVDCAVAAAHAQNNTQELTRLGALEFKISHVFAIVFAMAAPALTSTTMQAVAKLM